MTDTNLPNNEPDDEMAPFEAQFTTSASADDEPTTEDLVEAIAEELRHEDIVEEPVAEVVAEEVVEALTGVWTDRLPEERERGISIDLGFAALDLGPDAPPASELAMRMRAERVVARFWAAYRCGPH